MEDESEYKKFRRMTPENFDDLLNLIECDIKNKRHPSHPSMKTSVSSFLLALPAFLLNDLQVLFYKAFIFIQTDIYVNSSMQISRCCQDKTMVSDDFKKKSSSFSYEEIWTCSTFSC